jgi:hypothetical protein
MGIGPFFKPGNEILAISVKFERELDAAMLQAITKQYEIIFIIVYDVNGKMVCHMPFGLTKVVVREPCQHEQS